MDREGEKLLDSLSNLSDSVDNFYMMNFCIEINKLRRAVDEMNIEKALMILNRFHSKITHYMEFNNGIVNLSETLNKEIT